MEWAHKGWVHNDLAHKEQTQMASLHKQLVHMVLAYKNPEVEVMHRK